MDIKGQMENYEHSWAPEKTKNNLSKESETPRKSKIPFVTI